MKLNCPDFPKEYYNLSDLASEMVDKFYPSLKGQKRKKKKEVIRVELNGMNTKRTSLD